MGGLGIIHKNLNFVDQALEVSKVKRFESGMVINPVTISPDETLNNVLKKKKYIIFLEFLL